MARQNKITISFSREYQNVYEFLNTQVNASGYVCKLVREQISNHLDCKSKDITGMVSHGDEENSKFIDDLKKSLDGFDL